MTDRNPDVQVRTLDTYYQRIIPRLIVADEKASGVSGGTFTSGAWRTRDLNTVRLNNINGASLVANQITLPRGVYIIRASAPAMYVQRHQSKLRNVTDGTDVVSGSSEYSGLTTGDLVTTRSFIIDSFSISSSKVFEIQHQCATTRAGNGFGTDSSFGINNTYTIVEIAKIG